MVIVELMWLWDDDNVYCEVFDRVSFMMLYWFVLGGCLVVKFCVMEESVFELELFIELLVLVLDVVCMVRENCKK